MSVFKLHCSRVGGGGGRPAPPPSRPPGIRPIIMRPSGCGSLRRVPRGAASSPRRPLGSNRCRSGLGECLGWQLAKNEPRTFQLRRREEARARSVHPCQPPPPPSHVAPPLFLQPQSSFSSQKPEYSSKGAAHLWAAQDNKYSSGVAESERRPHRQVLLAGCGSLAGRIKPGRGVWLAFGRAGWINVERAMVGSDRRLEITEVASVKSMLWGTSNPRGKSGVQPAKAVQQAAAARIKLKGRRARAPQKVQRVVGMAYKHHGERSRVGVACMRRGW